jgi:prepilin signal peptidase PulO-like enzyme (type II secretory pathway)
MNGLVFIVIFLVFSVNSVFDDIRDFKVRICDIGVGIIVVLIVKLLLSTTLLYESVIGGSIGVLSFYGIMRFSRGRLGAGDVWFSALIGTAFGFWTWDLGILLAAFLGMLWIGIVRIAGFRSALRDIRIPFVPFMFVGSLAVSIYRGFSAW